MANTIIIKNSSTVSDIPTAGQLVEGELAISTNPADRKLYSKDSGGTVFEIGADQDLASVTAIAASTAEACTFSGGIAMTDSVLDRSRIKDYSIESDAEVVSANAVTLTYTDGPAFEIDLEAATGTVAITVTGGPPSGTFGEIIVKVQQDSTADRTLTWAGGAFVWPGATVVDPKTGSDAITIYYLQTWNGGTTWYITGVEYG